MTTWIRLGSFSVLLLVPLLWTPSARAQDAMAAAPSTTDAAATRTADFCRANWFAMGRCRTRKWTGPEITVGVDFGVSAMTEAGPFGFGKGVGSATDAGPSWGYRASIELLPWLGLEGRYVGAFNGGQASVTPGGAVGFLSSGAEAAVRFTAPLPFVRPYVLAGVGYYDVAVVGGPGAQAASVLHSSVQPGIPMGVGIDVPLTWYFSLDLEAAYHFQLGESFASVTTNGINGGDLTTLGVVLRARPW